MPKPSPASEASWIQTWHRRSRLRSSSQVTHRNPRNPRNTAIIALDLDDEPIAISEPLSPIGLDYEPSPIVEYTPAIVLDDKPVVITEAPTPPALGDEPFVIAEAPTPPALGYEPFVIAEAPASIAETPPLIATAETPPPLPPPQTDNTSGYSERNDDRDDLDPQWSYFLDHLKLDGESYRLEMSGISLKYEDANDVYSCNVATPPLSDTRKWKKKKEKRRSVQLDVLDGYDARENTKSRVSDHLDVSDGYDARENKKSRVSDQLDVDGYDARENKKSRVSDKPVVSDVYDARENKKSRVSDQPVVSDGYDARENKKRRVSDQLELEGGEVDEDYEIFRKHARELPNGSMVLELGDGLVVRYEEDEGECKDLPECEDMGSVVDDDYMFFVSRARQRENGSMILELDNGGVVNYEEEEEGDGGLRGVNLLAGAVEVHVKTEHLDADGESGLSSTKTALRPSSTKTPLRLSSGSSEGSNHVVYEDDGCSIEVVGCTTPLFYGERLKAILDTPFDQSEYDKLMDMAECCKPVEGLRETRGISKSYPTDKLGRSYLDHYPKFAEKLKHADLDERLKLLRGFFYWLKNVVHDGAFKPWECESSSDQTLPSNGSISLAIEIPED